MNILKVSSSGQITMPKSFREKYQTDLFTYILEEDKFIVIPVKVTKIEKIAEGQKYDLKDLKTAIFDSKNKGVTNLSEKIDQIIYQ